MNETDGFLMLVRPTGFPPPGPGEGEVRLVLSGTPGEDDAPDLEAVVDAILAHARVVVW
jgi:hypothetical protein